MLRYFNFEPSLKLRWCRAQDLFGSQIPVTTGRFELRISCIKGPDDLVVIRQRPCIQEIRSSNPPVVTGICDPNKSRARHIAVTNISFSVHTIRRVEPNYLPLCISLFRLVW